MAGTSITNRGKLVYVKAKKTKPHEGGHWSEKKKHESVVMFAAGMPIRQISVELNIPFETVKKWRYSEWFAEMVEDLRSDDKQKLDAKLTKILDKTLDELMDRLENGEFVYDQKTGELKRTPVKLRDTTVAFNTIMDKRQLIRREPTKITEQSNTATQLANLAQQFASFVSGQQPKEKLEHVVNEFIDGDTVVQDGDGTYSLKE